MKINLAKSWDFYSTGIPRSKINYLTAISNIRSTTSIDKYLGFPILKVRATKSDFNLSSKRCKLGWLLGNTAILINLAGWILLLRFCLPYLLTTCKSLGSLRIYVTSLIERPMISFGIMLTTKVSTWLVGIKLLDLMFGAALALEWRETLILLFLVNLFRICFRGQINFGSTSYLTSTPMAPRFSITQLLHPTQSLGTPLSKPKIFSRIVSLGRLARASPLFGIVIGPLCANVPCVHINELALKINEVYATTRPNLNMFRTLLPSDMLDEIINLKLHFNSNTEDTFIWHENSNGIYTTKTGFSWLLKQRGGDVTSILWAWIWRLHIPEKINFLVWLAHNNYVPTLSILNHKNLAPNALCPRCSSSEEPFLHCIRDYTTSTHLWHALGLTSIEFFSNTDSLCWLKR